MPSQKEVLQSKVAEADRQHQAATADLTARTDAVTATKAKIADLQRRYEAACVEAAQGNAKAEDPSTLHAQLQSLQHRLRGETQLCDAAVQAHGESSRKLSEAQSSLNALADQEELQRLEAAIATADADVKSAQAALADATKKTMQARHDRWLFMKKLERQARQAA